MKTIPQRAKLHEVAALAGVSRSTVSRVLSGATNVSPSAVAAVTAASKQLDYRPDPIARAMRRASSGCIGIIVPGVANPFFASLIEAVESQLQDRDLDCFITDSRGDVDHERRRLNALLTRRVDGVLIVPVDSTSSASALRFSTENVPVVQIDRSIQDFDGDYVGVNSHHGIRLVLDHLIAQGVQRVSFISGDASSSTGRSRLDAFESLIRQRPHIIAEPPVLGQFTFEFGQSATREILSHGTLPDAVVCGSDMIALGSLSELGRRGIRVPGDLLLTGFDGVSILELVNPPVTTVRQPLQDIASEAIRLLESRMNGYSGSARQGEISPQLLVRESTTRKSQEIQC